MGNVEKIFFPLRKHSKKNVAKVTDVEISAYIIRKQFHVK